MHECLSLFFISILICTGIQAQHLNETPDDINQSIQQFIKNAESIADTQTLNAEYVEIQSALTAFIAQQIKNDSLNTVRQDDKASLDSILTILEKEINESAKNENQICG